MAAVGKYKLYNEGGFFFKYRLLASNGQPLIISEPYKDEKACRAGIETLKKNVESLKVTFEKDKHDKWCFRLITAQGRPLAQSANYDSKKAAESAAGSYKKFVDTDKIEVDEAESKHYEVELFQDEVEDKAKGVFEISNVDGDFTYILKASNGRVLCSSQIYSSFDSCKQAMENFRKTVFEGDFYIFIDKREGAFFKLYSKQLRLVMTGEIYATKALATSAIKSIQNFAKLAVFKDTAK